MSGLKVSDVVIVGAGITGLATALFLKRHGIENLMILDGGAPNATALSAGIACGGLTDNFTRVSHTFGLKTAADLWRFNDAGFDRLQEFCTQQNIPFSRSRRVRLITSESELTEAKMAVMQMRNMGIESQLLSSADPLAIAFNPSLVKSIQDDGMRGAIVDVSRLVKKLKEAIVSPVEAIRIVNIKRQSSNILITTENGQTYTTEIVVLCGHLGISTLLPELHDALIPYADQWHEAAINREISLATGLVFSANHGYEWGAVANKSKLLIGGGRFLRPDAGIGSATAEISAKSTNYLQARVAKLFQQVTEASLSPGTAIRECLPCDELPIIGPMFGDGRILLSVGYHGTGLTMGFNAGYCLSQLIATGKSQDLPFQLWPHRLRSLG